MKNVIIGGIAWLTLAVGAPAQTISIGDVLRYTEMYNTELQAADHDNAARKLVNRSENNLSDPTVSYSHMWGEKDHRETIGELTVSQQFDFPTLYAARSKVNRLKASSLDARYSLLRQDILLQAQELCIDMLLLQQRQQLLDERGTQAEELAAYYKKRLETGDANILETNKTNLELLNVRTERATNQTDMQNTRRKLLALTANRLPVTDETAALLIADEPLPTLPDNWTEVKEQILASDLSVRSLTVERDAVSRQLAVDKQGWIPKLELGYRRNTESGVGFSGLMVGGSLPIFSNRGKKDATKRQQEALSFQLDNRMTQADSELTQLYAEAVTLRSTINEYRLMLKDSRNLNLLKEALKGGQLNVTEYFVEANVVFQSRLNLLQLENRYRKVLAQIYKSVL
jgi:outer membrane protein TolC